MNDTPTPTTAVRRSTSSEDVSDDPHLNTLIAIRDRLAGIEADLAHAQGTRDANGALIVDRLGRLEGGVVAIGWDLCYRVGGGLLLLYFLVRFIKWAWTD